MTMQSKKRTNPLGSPIWRIVLTILGIGIFLYGAYFIFLGIVGVPVSATVTSVETQGNFNPDRTIGAKGTIVVEYTFTVPDGRTFSGSSRYQTNTDYTDPANVEQFKTVGVQYLSFLPQANQVSEILELRFDSISIPILGLVLIVLVNWFAVYYKKRQAASASPSCSTVPSSAAAPEEDAEADSPGAPVEDDLPPAEELPASSSAPSSGGISGEDSASSDEE